MSGMSNVARDRVVLITGAGSGIGAALARRIAAPRTALMLHARGADDEARQRFGVPLMYRLVVSTSSCMQWPVSAPT